MVILIVGPTGVGKTTMYRSAKSHFPKVVFGDLDGMAAKWGANHGLVREPRITMLNQSIAHAELFLGIGLLVIGELSGDYPNQHLVVDVGAGFQVAQTAQQLHRLFRVIAITAEPEVAYRRIRAARDDDRTFEQYKQQEYAPNRVAVYNSAQHSIDSSRQTEQQTCSSFVDLLSTILPA